MNRRTRYYSLTNPSENIMGRSSDLKKNKTLQEKENIKKK